MRIAMLSWESRHWIVVGGVGVHVSELAAALDHGGRARCARTSIAWGIREVFNNFLHARWMGERGRVEAAYEFSWDVIAAQTESVYREIM
jgi:hypothetical protein